MLVNDAYEIVDDIVDREGGFVDHPQDRGGPTKYGITIPTLAAFRGVDRGELDNTDIADLGAEEAKEIYRHQYVKGPGFHRLPEPLRTVVVDFGVTSGPARATRYLQKVVGVTQDGVLGPITMRAVKHACEDAYGDPSGDVEKVAEALLWERQRFLGALVHNDPTQATFIHGWTNRNIELRELWS